MKTTSITIIIALAIIIPIVSIAQKKPSKLITDPKEKITLRFENQEDGLNGSAVAFHSGHKTYYSVIAGNAKFPLEVFNKRGDFIQTNEAGIDCRGLWYNPKTKCLETNSYDGRIYCIVLGDDGLPTGETSVILEKSEIKQSNNCAQYDVKKDYILIYIEGKILLYKHIDGSLVKSIELKLPCPQYQINNTNFIYTTYKNLEIGLLNCEENEIYFFSIKTGQNTATLKLPEYIKPNCQFRFDFVNDFLFFYDIETRTWTGIKIF